MSNKPDGVTPKNQPMSKEQMAVYWLANTMLEMVSFDTVESRERYRYFVDEAVKMMEYQLKRAYVEGSFAKIRHYEGRPFVDAHEYFNQKYKI